MKKYSNLGVRLLVFTILFLCFSGKASAQCVGMVISSKTIVTSGMTLFVNGGPLLVQDSLIVNPGGSVVVVDNGGCAGDITVNTSGYIVNNGTVSFTGNWLNNIIGSPTVYKGSGTLILNGTLFGQNVNTGTGKLSVNNLTITGTSKVLSGTMIVGNQFDIQATLFTTAADTFGIDSTGGVINFSASGNFVQGPMYRRGRPGAGVDPTPMIFPVADASGIYRPLILSNLPLNNTSNKPIIGVEARGHIPGFGSLNGSTPNLYHEQHWVTTLVDGNIGTGFTAMLTYTPFYVNNNPAPSTLAVGVYGPTPSSFVAGPNFTSIGQSSSTAATVTSGATPIVPALGQYTYLALGFVCNPVTATLNVAPNDSICPGATATFSVTAPSGNYDSLYYYVNNVLTALKDSGQVFTSSTLPNNALVYAIMKTGTCMGDTTNKITMKVSAQTADAGLDMSSCGTAAVTLSGSSTFSSSTQWISSGTGTFGSAAALSTTYTPSAADVSSGSVILTLRANSPGCALVNDGLTLTLNSGPALTASPVNSTICAGANTSFSVTATGAGLTYQWQEKVGAAAFANIADGGVYSGATTATLTLTAVPAGMSTNQYRVLITGTCPPSVFTVAVTLTVNPAPAVSVAPANQIICAGANASFSVTATGAGLTYQWQEKVGAGAFANIANGGVYSGATTSLLTLTAAPVGMSTNQYQVIVSGTCAPSATSASATLTVNVAPAITTQPVNTTICAGANATFTVAATGGGLTYQWQEKVGAAPFANLANGGVYSGVTSASLTLTAAPAGMSTNQYRVIVTGTCAPAVTSSTATLTVNTSPAITTQPTDQTICAGANTSFTVTVTGAGLIYQWQVDQGAGWANVPAAAPYSGSTSATLTITGATAAMNGYKYQVGIGGSCVPIAISNTVTLTVSTPPAVTTQPTDQTACVGGNATFTAVATGAGLTYQWQLSTGGAFANLTNTAPYSGVTTAALNITAATAVMNGYRYQLVISGTCLPAVTSSIAALTVSSAPAIIQPPAPQTVCPGANTSFLVTASGAGLTYQWQEDPNTGVFANVANGGVYGGATTNALALTGVPATMDNYKYRVVVTGTCAPAVTSASATLRVNAPPAITTQPLDKAICGGSSITFTVAATGAGLTYQWQEDPNTGTFANVANGGVYSGATSAALTLTTPPVGMNNYKYKVIITGTCAPTATSTSATLTIGTAPAITLQPAGQAICAGANATFSVTATGSVLTYQWQEKVGAAAFTNIVNGGVYSGATSATLTLTGVPVGMNGNKYQVIVSGTCLPSVTSSITDLTVGGSPAITTQPTPKTICATASTSFTVVASGAGLTYQWQEKVGAGLFANIANGGVYSGATTASLTLTAVPAGMSTNQYQVIVTGACAPLATSNAVALTVNSAPAITTQPTPQTVCSSGNATFTVVATGAVSYQWQEKVGAAAFTNISNGGVYAGATSASLTLTGVTAVMNSNQYQVIVTGSCAPTVTSNAVALTVNAAPSVSVQPANQNICANSNATFSVTALGNALTYQWQEKVGAAPFANISNGGVYSGATTSTLTLTAVPVGMSTNQYQAIVTGTCAPSATSSAATLTVTPTRTVNAGPDQTFCTNSVSGVTLAGSVLPAGATTWSTSGTGSFAPNANTLNATYTPSPLDKTLASLTMVLTFPATGGCPAASDQMIINMLPGTLSAPVVTTSNITSSSIEYDWSAVANASSYQISIDGGAFGIPSGPLKHILSGQAPSTNHCAIVQAVNACTTKNSSSVCATTLSGIACDTNWSVAGAPFCIATPKTQLTPTTAGGVFTGTGVVLIAGTYYFDPSVSGPGTFNVTYTRCGKSLTKALVVNDAPCTAPITPVGVGGFPLIANPQGIATDCDGSVYFSDTDHNAVWQIDPFSTASVIIGDTNAIGDGTGTVPPSSNVKLHLPEGLVAYNGDIYFTDALNHKIKKYTKGTPSVVSVVAGTTIGNLPLAGSTTTALAKFNTPSALTIDVTGTILYVADRGNKVIKKIDLVANTVTLIASTTIGGVAGLPDGLALYGNSLYYSVNGSTAIGVVDLTTNATSTYYKLPVQPPLSEQPFGLSVDCKGKLYFTDSNNGEVKQVTSSTTSTSLLGGLNNPTALSVYNKGFVDIANSGANQILRYAITNWKTGAFNGLDTTHCLNDPADALIPQTCAVAGGYSYSGNGIQVAGGNYSFNPAAAGVGRHRIVYKFTAGFCQDSLITFANVYGLPAPNLGPDTSVCVNNFGSFTLNAGKNGTKLYTSYTWYAKATSPANTVVAGVSGQFYTPPLPGSSPFYYGVTVVDSNGCVGSDERMVSKLILTALTITGTDTICYGGTSTLTATAGFSSYSWNTGAVINPVVASASGDYIVNATNASGCVSTATFRVTVRNLPEVCISAPALLGYGTWSVSTIAGSTSNTSGTTDNVKGTAARFNTPRDIYFSNGNLYVSEVGRIRKIQVSDTMVSTFAGSLGGIINDSVPRLQALFNTPNGVVADRFGNLYIANADYIAKLDIVKDSVYVLAGMPGNPGFMNGTGRLSQFDSPQDIEIDYFGNLYVADYNNHVIRKITPAGVVTTYLGTGGAPAGHVDAVGPAAKFNWPFGVSFDVSGNLYVIEEGGQVVRKANPSLSVSTVAGAYVTPGYVSNVEWVAVAGGAARFANPWNGVTDKSGRLFMTDALNHGIRMIDVNGNVTTLAGTGVSGGADGLGNAATFNQPNGITMDPATGALYVADRRNHKIRKVTQNKTISICSGTTVNVSASSCAQPGTYTYAWTKGGVPVAGAVGANCPVSAAGTYIVTVTDTKTNCSNTDSIIVALKPLPVANAGADTISCGPVKNKKLGSAAIAGNTYSWNTKPPAGVPFSAIAQPTVSLINSTTDFVVTVTGANGCLNSDTVRVTINSVPPTVLGADTTLCASQNPGVDSIQIGRAPIGNKYLYTWRSFPPSTPITTTGTPIRVDWPTATINYEVTIKDTSSTSNGCITLDTLKMTVQPLPPNVAVISNGGLVCRGTKMTINVPGSNYNVYDYLWVKNGAGPTGLLPNDTTVTNVTYDVQSSSSWFLNITNKVTGCTREGAGFAGVNMLPSPVAGFTSSLYCLPDSTIFNDTSSTTGGGSITDWIWTFGEPSSGSSDTITQTSQAQVYHKYAAPGIYGAKLIVINNANSCRDTATANITINDITAGFTISPATVCLGSPVSFTNSSAILPAAVITYNWDFGDASTSTAVNPSHLYGAPNTFTVKLKASASGCSDSTTQSLTVFPIPDATITATALSACNGTNDTLKINSLYDSPAYTVVWTNQTTNSVVANDTSMIIVSTGGSYKATVTQTASGCDDADSVSVNFINLPVGPAIVAPATTCSNAALKLIGTVTSGDSLSYSWITTNGSGVFSAANNDTTFYTPAALDPPVLNFTFSAYNRCDSLTATQNVTLLAAPTGSFTFTPAEPFENDLISIVNNTDTVANNIVSYGWIFDDGTTSTLFNPTHAFQTAGKHIMTFSATSSLGCTGLIKDSVYVSGPRIFIPNVFAPTANNPENSVCKVYGVGISPMDFSFKIFDKWGSIVYQTTDFNTANTLGWNGNNLSGGDPLPMGVYTYAVKGHFFDGDTFEKAGTVTLVR
ncbi:MAG: PKD domain-containing protein [Cytophagaceae bacterium]